MSQRARSAYPSLSRLRIGANSLTPATMNDLPRELVERIIWCLKSEDPVSDITRLVHTRILNRQQFQPVIDRLMLATNQPLSGILLAEPEDGGCAQVIHDLGVLSSPPTSNELEPQNICKERVRPRRNATGQAEPEAARLSELASRPPRLVIDSGTTDQSLRMAFKLLQTGLRRGLQQRSAVASEACPSFWLYAKEQDRFPLFAVNLFRLPWNVRQPVGRSELSTTRFMKRIHAAKPVLSEDLVGGLHVLRAWDPYVQPQMFVEPTLASVREDKELDAYVDLLQDTLTVSAFEVGETPENASPVTIDVTLSVVAKLKIRRSCRPDAVEQIEKMLQRPSSEIELHEMNNEEYIPQLFDFTLLSVEIGGTRYEINTYYPTSPRMSPTGLANTRLHPPSASRDADAAVCSDEQFGLELAPRTRYSDQEGEEE